MIMKRENADGVRSWLFGRKRMNNLSNVCINPSKRQSFPHSFRSLHKSVMFEDLPKEILIKIFCGVEHDDLRSLFLVSRKTREASLIAKQTYFAYSTPRKTTNFSYSDDFNVIETPDAPKQSRVPHPRLNSKKLAEISVKLFAKQGFD